MKNETIILNAIQREGIEVLPERFEKIFQGEFGCDRLTAKMSGSLPSVLAIVDVHKGLKLKCLVLETCAGSRRQGAEGIVSWSDPHVLSAHLQDTTDARVLGEGIVEGQIGIDKITVVSAVEAFVKDNFLASLKHKM